MQVAFQLWISGEAALTNGRGDADTRSTRSGDPSAVDERVTTALHELFVEQLPIPVDFVECYRRGGFVALRPAGLRGAVDIAAPLRVRVTPLPAN